MGQALTSGLRRGPALYKLNFAFTYNCNSRCVTCDIWKKKPQGEMTPDEVGEFARKARTFSWVSLTGGEPFTRTDTLEIVRVLHRNLPHLALLNIPTNGSLPDRVEEAARTILDLGVPKLLMTVSLDGDESVHDKTRGIPGGWRKALESYRRLRRLAEENRRMHAYFSYTVSPWNLGGFEETFQAVRRILPEVLPRDFHVNLYHTSPHYYANQEEGREFLREFIRSAMKELEVIGQLKAPALADPINCVESTYLQLAKRYLARQRTPLPCKSLISTVFVDSVGDVYPCTIWGRKLGNLRESDYDLWRILRNGESSRARQRIARGECPNCWTPCESYPMLFGSPLASARALLDATLGRKVPLPALAPGEVV